VLRGGNWFNHAQNVRAANRNANHPGNRNHNIGFRCSSSRGGLKTLPEQTRFRSINR
jgi:hypothetical protein